MKEQACNLRRGVYPQFYTAAQLFLFSFCLEMNQFGMTRFKYM